MRFILLLAILGYSTAAAQTSTLYVTGNDTIFKLRGGHIVAAVQEHHSDEGVIAIFGDVRTRTPQFGNPPQHGLALVYDLSLNYVGPTVELPPTTINGGAHDGTTDGIYNYATNGGWVARTDRMWNNEESLFLVNGGSTWGITYDRTSNSLWVASYIPSATNVFNYSMNGALLGGFVTPYQELRGLAIDPADHTLWFSELGEQSIVQFSTSGEVLSIIEDPMLARGHLLGAEFDEEPVTTPEPDTLMLCSLALAGVAVMVTGRRRFG